jgi:ParB family chromosome partitioning protein
MSRHTSTVRPDENAVLIPLSKLAPGRHNPRRVKPERDAHRRLVASVRAHGLLQPLIVRPDDATPGSYRVTAGNRRLAALREAHKAADDDPRVPCVIRPDEGDDAARAVALAENFAREPMHPLDEATAFAKLAKEDGRDADAIAADFGVTPAYVKQRMKLATLAGVVQSAYRAGTIDTATAEAFAAVPPQRQEAVWAEVGGTPQHASHVRNVIAHGWVDAAHALFDVATLPAWTVSGDLFGDRVLVERGVFLSAQAEALAAERARLVEEGWAEVVAGSLPDVQDRLWAMTQAPHEYDPATTAKLRRLAARVEKVQAQLTEALSAVEGDDNDPDGTKADALNARLDALIAAERALTADAPVHYAVATKGVGTAFLILETDGRVRREYRIPRARLGAVNAQAGGGNGTDRCGPTSPTPPTSDDLRESQLATTFTHQALGVRQGLLGDVRARRRVLALVLHDHVHGEALAVRHEPNDTTLHADHTDGFASAARDGLRQRRAELDPFHGRTFVAEGEAYATLAALPDAQVEALIDLLTVECVTAHLQRPTPLVSRLATELGVHLRHQWRPDVAWLAGYQKAQLVHLAYDLRGPAYGPAAERKKKSELVAELAQLFADAAEGRMADAQFAAKLNAWLPANFCQPESSEANVAVAPNAAG